MNPMLLKTHPIYQTLPLLFKYRKLILRYLFLYNPDYSFIIPKKNTYRVKKIKVIFDHYISTTLFV